MDIWGGTIPDDGDCPLCSRLILNAIPKKAGDVLGFTKCWHKELGLDWLARFFFLFLNFILMITLRDMHEYVFIPFTASSMCQLSIYSFLKIF